MATDARGHASHVPDRPLLRKQNSYECAVGGEPLAVVLEEEEEAAAEGGGGGRGEEGKDGGVEISEVHSYEFDKEPLPVSDLW